MTNGDLSPILGLGNDIVEVERIRTSMDRHGDRFLEKLLTPKEQAYCLKYQDPVPHLTGRFAAKEAIVKALGTGFGQHAAWLDFEILNNEEGKPSVYFSATFQPKMQGSHILITISHCQLYAIATALWVRTNTP